jgi:hypothetical protein
MTAGRRINARLKAFMLACILSGLGLGVAVAQGAVTIGANEVHFPQEVVLRPELVPYELGSVSGNLAQPNTPFLKEPELSLGHVFRRVLQFGKDTNNAIALIWDQPTRKLYMDLNRNRDLTDDPTGVFVSANKGLSQLFTNVVLPVKMATSFRPAMLDLRLSSDADGNWMQAQLVSRCFWQAKVACAGEEWQVVAADSFSSPEGPAPSEFLLLRPWGLRTNHMSLLDPASGTVPFPDQLFWVDQAFHLERRFETDSGAPVCKLEFTPQQPPLTELKLSGESLAYAVFRDTNGYTALLRDPPATVKVPQGVYTISAAWLKKGSVTAFRLADKPLVVNATTATTLGLGGPLTNSVVLTRYGRRLLMNYQLKGADGGSYRMAQQLGAVIVNAGLAQVVGGGSYRLSQQPDRTKPPEFSVFHGGKKVLSGQFQFG